MHSERISCKILIYPELVFFLIVDMKMLRLSISGDWEDIAFFSFFATCGILWCTLNDCFTSITYFSLSYALFATSPNYFDLETKVMLKEITSEKGKTLSGNYQVNIFSTKIRDKTRHSHCLNSQKISLAFDLKHALLWNFYFLADQCFAWQSDD